MANYYCSDAQLTERMETDHPSLDSAAKRLARLRNPASRWVDSKYPYRGQFADIDDASPPNAVIQEATIAYGLYLAQWIMTSNAKEAQAQGLLEHATALLRIDKDTGEARFDPDAVTAPVATGTMTRDRDDERDALRNAGVDE